MYAMQYEIALPADYDMQIIRDRVAAKGAVLDDFSGLGLKAFLIRERGRDGSSVNEYAPFYLWADTAGMNKFLWGGGGFQGIIDSFGRPAVSHWTGVCALPGRARQSNPGWARKTTRRLPAGEEPAAAVAAALARARSRADDPRIHTAAVAVDPRRWELVEFDLMVGDAEADPDAAIYQVLHVCRPELESLPQDWDGTD